MDKDASAGSSSPTLTTSASPSAHSVEEQVLTTNRGAAQQSLKWTDPKQFWKEKKQASKQRKREARKEDATLKQQQWDALSPEEQERRRLEAVAVHDARRRQAEEHHTRCLHRWNAAWNATPLLIFDLGFLDVMNEAGKKSTMAQLKLSYSILRREAFPFLPILTSFDAKEPVFAPLEHFEGFKKYPMPITDGHWSAPSSSLSSSSATVPSNGSSETTPATEVEADSAGRLLSRLAKQKSIAKIVYLTADTDDVLTEIESDAAYIVGAFVDHNSKKGLTRDCAKQYGVRMARLPLIETMGKDLGNLCKVFTINHVVEVLCKYVSTSDWRKAFEVLPTRRVNNEGSRQERKRKRREMMSSSADGTEADECDGDAMTAANEEDEDVSD